jgi:hypothetical protein
MKIGVAGILIGFTFLSAQAQTKSEVEKRVTIGEVPEVALQLLQGYLDDASKIRWYFEQDGVHQSYECKFNLYRKKYSIEFDVNGQLEDVEISFPLRNLPGPLIHSLKVQAKKFKIKRSQIQFKVLKDEIFQPLVFRTAINQSTINLFELEVILDGEYYELLIDSTGKMISKRRIISPTGIYLEF